MAIRLRLKNLLDDRGMTQTELQSLTGLGYSSINAMYHNKTLGVEFGTLDAICGALKVQPGDLLQHIPDRSRRGAK
jgi:putative transcriptional regulator